MYITALGYTSGRLATAAKFNGIFGDPGGNVHPWTQGMRSGNASQSV